MTRRFLLPCAIALAASICTAAHAKSLGEILSDTGLVDSDFTLMKDAAATLYSAEPPVVGSQSVWQNPETGASGSIELTAFDGKCATLQHLFRPNDATEAQPFEARRCKDADGNWQLDFSGQ